MPPKKKVSTKSSNSNNTPFKTPTTSKSDIVCPMCDEIIVDATVTKKGQKAIFCEGSCGWLHRCCKAVLVLASQSQSKFFMSTV